MQKLDIGIYIVTAICIIGIIICKFFSIDTSFLIEATWALIGAIVGRNAGNISLQAKKIAGSFKKK